MADRLYWRIISVRRSKFLLSNTLWGIPTYEWFDSELQAFWGTLQKWIIQNISDTKFIRRFRYVRLPVFGEQGAGGLRARQPVRDAFICYNNILHEKSS